MISRQATLFLSCLCLGLADGHAETLELDTVVIESTRTGRPLADTPAAISVIDQRQIQSGQPRLQLDEALQRVPGVYTQNQHNFAQNLRISSRGFGARAPFGVRGIHIRVDGIPETLPDGQAQLDIIDLDNAQRIDVIRGPGSIWYGNAAGGVIDIRTGDGRDRAPGGTLRTDVGSHGLQKSHLRYGGQYDNFNHQLSVSELNLDGWREQSHVRKRLAGWQAGWQLDANRRLSVVTNALHTPVAEDPGGLTRSEARDDPRAAAPFATALDTGQQVRQHRLGLFYRDTDFAQGELNARLFHTNRDFRQQLPFPGPSLIAFQRDFSGAGVNYRDSLLFAGRRHRYTVGMDLEQQRDDRERFNVIGGEVTGRTEDTLQTATNSAFFLHTDSPLTDTLDLSLGLRFDNLRLRMDDRLAGDPDEDRSGARRFAETSYSAGLLWKHSPRQRGYLNLATAFESPTFTEFANPDGGGGFNPDIEPQQALSHEAGMRGSTVNGLLYDLAIFLVDVQGELIPFEKDGRTFFENAGRTRRQGIELALAYPLNERLSMQAAWTLADYRLVRFRDRDGNSYSGNHLPGLPEQQLFLELSWENAHGGFVRLDGRYQSSSFAENANVTRVEHSQVYNLSIGQRQEYPTRPWEHLQIHGGIRNLTGTDYFSNIRINANPDRPPDERRYFEPAPGRSLWLGFEVGF